MRLCAATAALLPASVQRPGYDRKAQRRGIVHLGVGAFHRAHQAAYTDAAMAAGDRNWAITGVSLRSADARTRLEPQDGLYTVSERGSAGIQRTLIGSVTEVIVAPEAPDATVASLASADTRVVTITVTEKGYCLTPDGSLDLERVARQGTGTIYHYLAQAFATRRENCLPGLTLISCDNLAGNGRRLSEAMATFLDGRDQALATWFASECACPSTMVDRIVPAQTDAAIAEVGAALGMQDEGAVVTENFRQWVIEDRIAGPRPRWEAGGATFVHDVGAFETAKLRMLNGAHSALAYLGILRGHNFVHQAVADAAIRPVVERLMRVEAPGGMSPNASLVPSAYADALLARFTQAALPHSLAQIAADGSQKIGPRWLESLAANRERGRTASATLRALAAWTAYVGVRGSHIDDPLAARLQSLWAAAGASGISEALFGQAGLFGTAWIADADELATLSSLVAEQIDQATLGLVKHR